MLLCACFLNTDSQTQILNETRYYISLGSLSMRVIDLQQSGCDGLTAGGPGLCNPQGLVPSPENFQPFIVLILGLHFPIVCCAALQDIPPHSGHQTAAPSWCLYAEILATKRPCCRLSSPCSHRTLLEPLVSRVKLEGLIYLSGLAPI